MPSPTLSDLFSKATKVAIYELALEVASSLGLDTTTWQAGDPTRSLYHVLSEKLASLEETISGYISSGFLDFASGDWLKALAAQRYGVIAPEPTFATTTVTLTNNGGGLFIIEPNDLTFKNASTGKTYHNTTGGTLASGPATTLDLTVEADEAGTESNASAGQITQLVTTLLQVTCSNAAAAVASDGWSDDVIKRQCRAALDYLSPAKGAYNYVALNSTLTGTNEVTRARTYSDSSTGAVSVYIAGPAGAVGSGVVADVQEAVLEHCTPLCITPTVQSVTNVTVAVTYELWVYKSCNKTTDEVKADVNTALAKMLAERPIGGDIIPPATTGALYVSLIESTIRAVYPQVFRVNVSLPASDVALTNGQVPVLGTVNGTVNLVNDP